MADIVALACLIIGCAIRLLGKGKGGLWSVLHALPSRDMLGILYSQVGMGIQCRGFKLTRCIRRVSASLDTERV